MVSATSLSPYWEGLPREFRGLRRLARFQHFLDIVGCFLSRLLPRHSRLQPLDLRFDEVGVLGGLCFLEGSKGFPVLFLAHQLKGATYRDLVFLLAGRGG